MPFDGSGNFSRTYNWEQDRDNGIRILAQRMDGEFDNFAGGLNQTFLRNGIVPMSAPLNMGQNSIVGLAAGSLGNLGLRFGDDPGSGLYLNGIGKPTLATGGINVLEVNNAGAVVTGTLSSTGMLSENGSRVWTAATLNPGNYAQLGGATFTGLVKSTNTIWAPEFKIDTPYGSVNNLQQGTGDGASYTLYNIALNAWYGLGMKTYDGSVNGFYDARAGVWDTKGVPRVNGTPVWYPGNFNPGNYALLSGATFTGDVRATGHSLDNTAYFAKDGAGNPILNMDANDYIQYNRTANAFSFVIANTFQASVDSSGTVAARSNVTVNGNNVWHAGNLNPGNYMPVSGGVFSGSVQAPIFTVNNASGDATLQIIRNGVQNVQLVTDGSGNFNVKNGAGTALTVGSDLKTSFNAPIFVGGQPVVRSGRSNGGGYVFVTDGTAGPSGGGDGDFYFQYT